MLSKSREESWPSACKTPTLEESIENKNTYVSIPFLAGNLQMVQMR